MNAEILPVSQVLFSVLSTPRPHSKMNHVNRYTETRLITYCSHSCEYYRILRTVSTLPKASKVLKPPKGVFGIHIAESGLHIVSNQYGQEERSIATYCHKPSLLAGLVDRSHQTHIESYRVVHSNTRFALAWTLESPHIPRSGHSTLSIYFQEYFCMK